MTRPTSTDPELDDRRLGPRATCSTAARADPGRRRRRDARRRPGARRARSPRRTPARSRSSTAPACSRRDARSWPTCRTCSAAPASYAMLSFSATPPIPSAARCCSACRSAARRSRPSCCSSSSSGRRSTTSAPTSCSPPTGSTSPPPPAHGAPLPAAPALRARGEDPRREGAHRPRRVDAAVRGAGVGDRRRASTTRREPSSLEVALARPVRRPTARCARGAGRARHRGARSPACARARYVFNTLLADKAVDDRLRNYPHWLAEPQPRQRGVRRVGRGADRRGPRALRAPRRWYRLKARLLGIDRLADYDRMAAVTQEDERVAVAGGARARARLLRALLRRARRDRASAFFDEQWIDAPVRPGQARRRVLRLHGAVRCTRTCC